jgi:xanthine dehydrogenase YagS FAD-binding subunit
VSAVSFEYHRATDVADALAQGSRVGASYLAGGTDLLQLCKAGVHAPAVVVDISRLPLRQIEQRDGGLLIGALARLDEVAGHAEVKREHPLIAQAIQASASGQIRNMASVGGNLLQRTRCPYFRSEREPCNKRIPGSGCGARGGENRHAALFGAGASCVATHPSDLAVALAALDAEIELVALAGRRRLALADLYPLPGDAEPRDTTLAEGEMIAAVRLQSAPRFARHFSYLKIRDRASFEFAVVSVAAALVVEDGVIRQARLAAGGVAPRPWRLVRSEAALIGRRSGEEAFDIAGDLAIEGARPLAHNGFKIELLRQAVVRALQEAKGKP